MCWTEAPRRTDAGRGRGDSCLTHCGTGAREGREGERESEEDVRDGSEGKRERRKGEGVRREGKRGGERGRWSE